MPMTIHCPGCDEPIRVPAETAGRLIRCKHCSEEFRVPRQRRFAPDEYDDEPAKKSALPIVIAAVVGVFLVAGGGVAALLLFSGEDKPVVKADRNKGPEPADPKPRPPVPKDDPASPVDPVRPPADPIPPMPEDDPPVTPRSTPDEYPMPWKQFADGPLVPPFGDAQPGPTRAAIAFDDTGTWSVTPDPAPPAPEMPADFQLRTKLPTFGGLFGYTGPRGTVAVIADESKTPDQLVTYDLVARKPLGAIRADIKSHEQVVSPSGKLIGYRQHDDIAVWSFGTGQPVAVIKGDDSRQTDSFAFLADESLLLVRVDDELRLVRYHEGEQDQDVVERCRIDDDAVWALSQTGKYVAFAKERLQVIRTEDLKTVGLRGLPKGNAQGVAFRPDGKEITVAQDYNILDGRRLTAWDIETGKVTASHTLLPVQGQLPVTYQGPRVAYFADTGDWLWWGRFIVEHDTGAILADLGFPPEPNRQPVRNVLPGNYILTVGEINNDDYLASTRADPAVLGAAREAARKALAPAETVTARLDGAKTLTAIDEPEWKVSPSEVRVPDLKSVPMGVKATSALGIFFAGPESGKAASLSRFELTAPVGADVPLLELYDLSEGKRVGVLPLNLPAGRVNWSNWKPFGDLGPEGTRFALRDPVDPARVDVWSLDGTGSHLTAFVPSGSEIYWLGLADADHLMTLDAAGTLVRWKLSDAAAVYRSEVKYRAAAFDPTRKLLATFRDGGWDLLDVETGEQLGRVGTEPSKRVGQAVAAAAFSPGGGKLASAVYGGEWGQVIDVWDLATGDRIRHFDLRPSGHSVQWVGDTFLMLGGFNLVDLGAERVIWGFDSAGSVLPRGSSNPDGRFWYVVQSDKPGLPGVLHGADLRGEVVRSGDPIGAVNLIVNIPDGNAGAKCGEFLSEQLRAYGFAIESGAPVTVHLSATVGSRDYKTGIDEVVSVPKITGKIALFCPDGREFWSSNVQGEAGPIFSDRVRGATDQTATAWSLFLRSVAKTALPRILVIEDGRAFPVPGISALPVR